MDLCNETFFYNYFEDSFGEFVSDMFVSLRKRDKEYKEFLEEKEKLLDSFTNLRGILEDDETMELSKNEVSALIQYLFLQDDQRMIEERELFLRGMLEAYSFFKKFKIIKE